MPVSPTRLEPIHPFFADLSFWVLIPAAGPTYRWHHGSYEGAARFSCNRLPANLALLRLAQISAPYGTKLGPKFQWNEGW